MGCQIDGEKWIRSDQCYESVRRSLKKCLRCGRVEDRNRQDKWCESRVGVAE